MAPPGNGEYINPYADPTPHGDVQGYHQNPPSSYYAPCPQFPPHWHDEEVMDPSQDPYTTMSGNFYQNDPGCYPSEWPYAYERGEEGGYFTEEWQGYTEVGPSGVEAEAYEGERGGVERLSSTAANADRGDASLSGPGSGVATLYPGRGVDSILAAPTPTSSASPPRPPGLHYPPHSASQPRKSSFHYAEVDASTQKARGGNNIAGPKALKTTARAPGSRGGMLTPSVNQSYASHHEREGNSSRHGVESSSGGGSGSTNAPSPPIFSITAGAPLLRVPTDLPVSITSLLDLIASFVIQGGPTFEEELLFRERSNPHFDFLRAPWNDPRVLYYRWRLYSLLQGDTMLEWRAEPFQMERSGSKAYAWVPPPAIAAGPGCLLKAFGSSPRDPQGGSQTTSPDSRPSREVDGEKGRERASELPPPSATWLSRQTVREGRVFVTLSEADEKKWQAMLNIETLLPPEVVDVMKNPKENYFSPSHSTPLESTLPPFLKRAKTDPSPEASAHLVGIVESIQHSLLNSDVIAERMIFAVEHNHAALHTWSILLDAVVKLAYECAGEAQKERSLSTDRALERDKVEGETASPNLRAGEGPHELPSGDADHAIRMHIMCFQLLFYLFIVHDTIQNANAEALTDDEAVEYAGYPNNPLDPFQGVRVCGRGESDAKETESHPETGVGGACGFSSSLMSGPSALPHSSTPLSIPSNAKLSSATPSSSHALLQEVEAILPTLIEAALLVSLTALHYFSNRLERKKGLETPPKSKTNDNGESYEANHKKSNNYQNRMHGKTLETGLNVKPEEFDAVTTYFPHMATILAMSTTQGGTSHKIPGGSSPRPALHEENLRVSLIFPGKIGDSMPTGEQATSEEQTNEPQLEKADDIVNSPAEGEAMDDAAGVVRARLLLVWLRQLLCWWMRYTPDTFWFDKSDGEAAAWGYPKCEGNPSDGAPNAEKMSVVLDTTVLPTPNSVIRGRTATLLTERYGFLLNNAYL
ncbi:unnamed protein product [Phytomonas sp. Hart1]|nr:unnamed protein product [Phytomonas sp. Hart1]|eukprot:CCW69073.1 unnamed protein product [Phytomonas sp. isolate Hart1]